MRISKKGHKDAISGNAIFVDNNILWEYWELLIESIYQYFFTTLYSGNYLKHNSSNVLLSSLRCFCSPTLVSDKELHMPPCTSFLLDYSE